MGRRWEGRVAIEESPITFEGILFSARECDERQ